MGLQVLEREKQVFKANPDMQPQLDKYEYVVRRQLKPKARMDIIHELASAGVVPSAMIDISDGLASEVLHLSRLSGVGFRLYEENLPIDSETYEVVREFSIDSVACMLNGGEDYELLFTIDSSQKEVVEKLIDVYLIGYVQSADKGNQLVTRQQNVVPIQAQGFKHFNK